MGVFAYIKNRVKYKQNQFPGAYPANRVSYNGSDVKTALDELNADIHKGSVSVTTDGVKTWSQLFDALSALADTTKISIHSALVFYDQIYSYVKKDTTWYFFQVSYTTSANIISECIIMKPSSSSVYGVVNGTRLDNSAAVPSSGAVITLYY